MKRRTIVSIGVLILMLLSGSISFAKGKQIQVNIDVAAMQELTIGEDVRVSFPYPWEGLYSGYPLIFRDIGNLNIKSNVDWVLNIGLNEEYREFEIYIRPAGSTAHWQRVDILNGFITGKYGSRSISWDLKIVRSGLNNYLYNHHSNADNRVNGDQDLRTVNMVFTLTQL